MHENAFWMRAARMSGRLDLSPFVHDGLDPATLVGDPRALTRRGVRLDLAARLASDDWQPSPQPHLPLIDPRYPRHLALVPHSPPVLFWEGELSLLHRPCVAVVGTRRCSPGGRRHARELARALARSGASVVSGAAWGIDTEAHTAAPGATVAVLGQGLAAPRTTRLARLCRSIVEAGGLVLSEFPARAHAATWTFPQRNRVVAGLCQATVVIEASHRSGALITARLANEAGREVWALPGDPDDRHRAGCLRLIDEGAHMYLRPDTLLEDLGLSPPATQPPPGATGSLVTLLSDRPDINTLVARTGRPLAALLRELAQMELDGRIHRLSGDRFGPGGRP